MRQRGKKETPKPKKNESKQLISHQDKVVNCLHNKLLE